MDEKYLYLFNEITKAIFSLDELMKRLMEAQERMEEIYISSEKDKTVEDVCSKNIL